MKEPTFDADGYPTDATLRVIAKWPIATYDDCEALLNYVRLAWRYPTYFRVQPRRFREYKGGRLLRRWLISTGGWSGNESLIGAMEKNIMLHALCWHSSQRGGHYEYRT